MALILCIETATEICSTALFMDGQLLNFRETNEPNSHSLTLGSFIKDILAECQINSEQLDAVAVSSGPGSYTGLRIGVSIAKGICYSLDIPLIAIPTLESMTYEVIKKQKVEGLYIPMLDAGRMEVYSSVFNTNLFRIEPEKPTIITATSFEDYAKAENIFVFGNGSTKCKTILESTNIKYIDNQNSSAISMGELAEKFFLKQQFVDTAYFEPFYLKEFQAKISVVKGLD
jgi:tRNA threonylcarbamoyladenosine biosynthesis protein TsaB